MNSRNPHRFLVAVAATLATALFAIQADADMIVVSATGAAQGVFKGESTAKGAVGKALAESVEYELASPRDPATGQPTGKIQHKPVVIEKRSGGTTPQWLAALAGNEALTILVEFYGINAQGSLVVYQTIKLDSARVASVQHGADTDGGKDRISLVYQKLEFTREGLKFNTTWGL